MPVLSSRNMMINNFIDKMKLPFRKEKELYSSLFNVIGFYPHDISLYKQALLHKSIAKRNEKGRPVNNERLEFLGDAILDAIVGDIVFRHFEGKREGFLTNTRSKIVQRETLNKLAQEIGISQLIMSNGHSSSHNSYMDGNAFEALVGAIYLDRGYEACMRFMKKRILSQLINLDKVAYKEVNFKSKLIEWCQKNRVKLDFKLIEQKRDENNNPIFVYQAIVEGLEGGSGKGYSKKESQQLASKQTLQSLRRKPQFIDAVFAAKADRTKMEEEPVVVVPDIEQKEDFIITAGDSKQPEKAKSSEPVSNVKPEPEEKKQAGSSADSEFDLSDITATPRQMSKEDIIAAAEAAAFQNKDKSTGTAPAQGHVPMLLSCFIVYHTTCSLTEASSVDFQDAAKLRKIINHKLGVTLLELFTAAVAVSNAHTAHAGAMSHAYVEGRIAHHDTLVGPQSVVFHRADHHVWGRLGVGHIARTEHVGYESAKLHVGHKAQQRRPRAAARQRYHPAAAVYCVERLAHIRKQAHHSRAVVLLEYLSVHLGTAVAHGVVHVDNPRERLLQRQPNHRRTLFFTSLRQPQAPYSLLHCAHYKTARIAHGAVKIKYHCLNVITQKLSVVHKKQNKYIVINILIYTLTRHGGSSPHVKPGRKRPSFTPQKGTYRSMKA